MAKNVLKYNPILSIIALVTSFLIIIGDAVLFVFFTLFRTIACGIFVFVEALGYTIFGFVEIGQDFSNRIVTLWNVVRLYFIGLITSKFGKPRIHDLTVGVLGNFARGFWVRGKQTTSQKTEIQHVAFTDRFIKLRYFLAGVLVTGIIVFFYESYTFVSTLPSPRLIGSVNFPVSTQIYDRNGRLLYEIYREQNRTPIQLQEIPEQVIQATIAIEDKDFYNHKGISIIGGIGRALKEMFRTGRLQGGSTITQQLVKTALLTPERTIERKVREAVLAVWTEQLFSKNEILAMYLNQVPYGGSAYGIAQASKTYFAKDIKDTTLAQAAFLAGLPQAPSAYSPYTNPQLAVQRRNEVLASMVEQGYISDFEYEEAVNTPLTVIPPSSFIKAPHFVFYVRSILEEQYGIRKVEEGGLRVTTSLDLDVQEKVEQMLTEELAKIAYLQVTNGAALVTVPGTGEVLAMIGSRNYFEQPSGAYNVTIARRQPGSSIKPLLYSLALSRDFTPATIINDSPVVFQLPGAPVYRPVNYDGRFHGQVPLRYALANSYNIPAVKTLNKIGVANFIEHAKRMGITTWDSPERYGLALALGGAEVTMVDMATAFGVFANSGEKVPLNPILEVRDYRGNILQAKLPKKESILDAGISYIISNILADGFARRFAFGEHSALDISGHIVSVKTGTTNDLKDNWTIGYTPRYLTAVWVGNNDNTPMSRVASGVTGASPIWNRVMGHLLNQYDKVSKTSSGFPSEIQVPEGLVKKKCFFGRDEYFLQGTGEGACRASIFSKLTPTQYPTQ